MSKLKTNWAIHTTDEQFKAYILTLEALGYTLFDPTKDSFDMEGWDTLVTNEYAPVSRGHIDCLDGETVAFQDISSFLIYHFSSEKTEAEKELEALQEKMNSLQEQIDRVKLSISK